jgi:O-antigen ligase
MVHPDTRVGHEFHWPSSLGLWMVMVYIGLFLIRPWELLMPWMQALRFERVYAIGMVSVVLLTGRGIRWTRQSVAVAMFALAVGLSCLQAWQSEYAWPQFYQYATVVVTFYVMVASCRRLSDLNWLIVTYIATMYVYLGKSLWEYFVHGRHEFAQDVSRLVGIEATFGEPNAVAMSAVVSLPMWYYLWRCRSELTWDVSGMWRLLFLAGLITYPIGAATAVGLTNSRAGMVGLAAFVAGLVWYSRHSLRPVPAAALVLTVILGLWLLAPSEQKNRLRTLWDPAAGPSNAQASAGGRWQGFVAACQMLRDRPLTGVGIGNFVPYRVARLDGVALVAHNLPGQVLGEIGWLGGICFLLLVLAIWRNARRVRSLSEGWFELESYNRLAVSLQLTVLLLLLFGLSLHNGLRYNWMWIAAFGCLAYEFCLQAACQLDGETDSDPRMWRAV